jgi:hypothetical protein
VRLLLLLQAVAAQLQIAIQELLTTLLLRQLQPPASCVSALASS